MGWTMDVFRGCYRGKGIGRTLMNLDIRDDVKLRGRVIDIGGKGPPSYQRFLRAGHGTRVIVLDLITDPSIDVAASVTDLPVRTESCDVVLCFNVLEHVFDQAAALTEIRRVLRSGGTLYGWVPFLVGVHADPQDYWRCAPSALGRLLTGSGFTAHTIRAHGGLGSVVFDLTAALWPAALLRASAAVLATSFDRVLTSAVGRARNTEKYVLGYFFEAS